MKTHMCGERVPATRLMGGTNSRHQYGYNSGGTSSGFGVLGPRRERHNRIAKRKANAQRRDHDRRAINAQLALAAQEREEELAEREKMFLDMELDCQCCQCSGDWW